MPYDSDKQAAMIHAKADQGVAWAMRYVRNARREGKNYVRRSKKRRRRRRSPAR